MSLATSAGASSWGKWFAHLSAQLGDALLHVARDAFTRGLNIAAVVGAAIATVIALLAGLQLRSVRADT